MPTFTTPTIEVPAAPPWVERGRDTLRFMQIPEGVSVVKIDGHYRSMQSPDIELLNGLRTEVDYFLGGRTYTISPAIGDALVADGYTIQFNAGTYGAVYTEDYT